jgi:hypothetical protein
VTEYAIRYGDELVRDPAWRCMSDVVGSFHGGFAENGRVTGTLVTREPGGEWREVPSRESTIAAEAHAAVYGPRGDDYGHPSENFGHTARIWSALLHDKLAEGQSVDAADVARCMIGVKLARDLHYPKRDNRVDMVGYAITLDRLETGE